MQHSFEPAVQPPVVVVLDDYQGVALDFEAWRPLEGRVTLRSSRFHIESQAELLQELQDAEFVVAMRERTALRRELLEQLPSLRLIITTGQNNSVIDRIPNITLKGTRALSSPTSELTWALILAARRNLESQFATLRSGLWQTALGESLEGQTLGLIGFGQIGKRVAAVGRSFGMRILAWSENLTDETAREGGAERVSFHDLLATSDIVSIHTRLSSRTVGLIDRRALGLMQNHALIVNTSRSAVIHDEALLEALHNRRIGGAAVDVFDQEPVSEYAPILTAPNVTATPHLGYVTRQNYELFFEDAARHIAEALEDANDGFTEPSDSFTTKETS